MLIDMLIAVVALVVALVVFISTRPTDFAIERSLEISAPPEVVFTQVNDFHQWNDWSPWVKLDPNVKNIYEGAPQGTGAIFAWTGNNKVGAGRMTVVESEPAKLIRIKLEFFRPFKATNDTLFTFKYTGGQTKVTWRMSGKNNFISKTVGLFINCDKMVGEQFEEGLARIKAIAETAK